MLTLFILANAVAFRFVRGHGDINGDGIKDIPRWVWIVWVLITCWYFTPNLITAAAWVWVNIVLGVMPTQSLFTAVHGRAPTRRDAWPLDKLQDLAGVWTGGRKSGIEYAALRGCLALPAFPFIGWLGVILCLSHGLIYYLWGRRCIEGEAIQRSELTIGFLIALGMVTG